MWLADRPKSDRDDTTLASPIDMRKRFLCALAVAAALAITGVAGGDGPPSTRLVETARQAGMEASPLVFESDAGAHPDDSPRTRISGKSLVLATAIATAAAITVAWLLQPRSECVGARGLGYGFARAVVEGRAIPAAGADAATGHVPPPLPAIPPVPLPELCVPREKLPVNSAEPAAGPFEDSDDRIRPRRAPGGPGPLRVSRERSCCG